MKNKELVITVFDLTNLFKEKYYAIEYIDYENGTILKPFDFRVANDILIVKGFKLYVDKNEGIPTLLIGVDKKQYLSIKNNSEIGANLTLK